MSQQDKENQDSTMSRPEGQEQSDASFPPLSHQFTTAFDREFHSRLGRFWALSPASIGGAYFDWMTHLAISPGKQIELMESALKKSASLLDYSLWATSGIKTECCIEPTAHDRRFEDESWETLALQYLSANFLINRTMVE